MKVKGNAAAEKAHTAAETGAAMITDAWNRISPLVEQGRDKLTPFVEDGLSKLAPLADEARTQGSKVAAQANEKLAPARAVAMERYEELLPKLGDALEQLARNENAVEIQHRGLAALAAMRGDLSLPKKERKRLQREQLRQIKALQKQDKKKGGFVGKFFLFALLGGVGYFLWKQFGAKSESEWQSHDPKGFEKSTTQSFSEPVDAPEGTGVKAERADYGDDAFVGTEPPAGYTIKGNERSMKYHTPESGGYDRTIADVWFTTEEAAEKAGFSKAQR